jgi:hypothetical protein
MAQDLKVRLFPNTEVASVFYHELFLREPQRISKYDFSCEGVPSDSPVLKLRADLLEIVEVEGVDIRRNEIRIELNPMSEPRVWFPKVLAAIRSYAGEGYKPRISLQDSRNKTPGVYEEDGYMSKPPTYIEGASLGVKIYRRYYGNGGPMF